MRILIGADTYAPDVNGASYFAQRLAHALTPSHEVHVVCPATTAESRTVFSSAFSPAKGGGGAAGGGVVEHRVRSLPILRRKGFRFCAPVGLVTTARKILQFVKPDVVHVQSHFPLCRALVTAANELGIPVVATNHFMPENLSHYLPVSGGLKARVEAWAWADAAKVLTKADVVTAPTLYAAVLAENKGVPGPVLPISCGMDLTRFRTGTSATAFRLKYRVPQRPTIAYVGRLDLEKNLDVLVKALPAVRRRVADAQLMLVGTGDQRHRLEALAHRLGVTDAVIFTGFVDDADLPAAYAAADVFVNAGTAELQSLVTLEAMASGLPVLGADASALPHLVHHGDNGFLFPPGDAATLAGHLVTVLSDHTKARSMGVRSRALAEHHDLASTVAAFEKLYSLRVAEPVLAAA